MAHHYNELLGLIPLHHTRSIDLDSTTEITFPVLTDLVFGSAVEKLLDNEFRLVKDGTHINVGEIAFVASRSFDAITLSKSDIASNANRSALHVWACRMRCEPYSALAWFLLDQQYGLVDNYASFPDNVPDPASGLTFDIVASFAQQGINDINVIRNAIENDIDISLMQNTASGGI